MSNYNWQDLPEELADFKGMIVVGGEVMNGTGSVQARFYDDEHASVPVLLLLDVEQAEALAKVFWKAAHDARWAMFSANMGDGFRRGDALPEDPHQSLPT